PGIDDQEVRQLRERWPNREALEETLDDDAAEGIKRIAEGTGLSRERVIELLSATLCERGKSLTIRWFAAHWFDFALLSIIVILVALSPIGTIIAEYRDAAAARKLPVHAALKREIAPYTPLKKDDLNILNDTTSADRDKLVGDIVGHYSTRVLAANETIEIRA